MPRLPHLVLLPLALAAAVALTGCVPDNPPVPSPSPSPAASGEPLFASEDEALAAAEEAFAKYLKVVDAISQDGGQDPDRLREVATDEVLEFESAGFDRARLEGLRSTGRRTFDSVRLQHADVGVAPAKKAVSIYVCVDLTKVDVVDEQGNSVVVASRDVRIAEEVYFDATPEGALIVSSTADWTGEDFCG